ncbi:MAG: DUF5916 domain-containing protein [Gemmatimonadota bacterium]
MNEDGPRSLPAVPREGQIELDGSIDEAAWNSARSFSNFVQSEPVEGVPAEHDTRVQLLIDDEAIWVAARMYDPRPSTIGTQLVRRDDRGAYDWFSVSLDPNLDRRTGYTFQVSAAGVQMDQYLYDDERDDPAWDAVWESAVRIDSLGWTAELRIPLSQIRYESGAGPQTWGVNFARRRLSSNELSYFQLRSRLKEGVVSQFGTLREVRVPGSVRRIEVRPYLLSSLHDGPAEEGDPFFSGREASARVGADLRFGLGSAFTLDATVNPDFGQVEADPAVINLSAFETFFEERRPFFVEDAQIFDFSLAGHQNQLFYSRRIGRNPHGDAPDEADFAEIPDAATILGAAKVTGRTSGGLSLGALGAVTQQESGRAYFAEDERTAEFTVEPRSEFGVVRLQQDFNDGASQIGGIVTGMRRELTADGSFDFLPSDAVTGGVRFEHQWNDRDWKLGGFLAASHVRGAPEAMIRLQRSSNHYFQRPDATRMEVDSAATSMTGAEWRLELNRQNGEHWTGGVWIGEVTKGFDVNDLGYSRSSEQLDGGFRVSYREITPGDLFRSYRLSLFSYHNVSHEALDDVGAWDSWREGYLGGSVFLSSDFTFLNYWGTDLNLSWSPDAYSHTATRGGPTMRDPGSLSVRAGVNSDRRKNVHFRGGFSVRQGFDGSGSERSVSGSVSVRPSSRIELELEPRLSVQTDGAQYVTSTSDVPFEPTYGSRYLFGELDRTTVSMETRLDWTFSPTLSLQLFAQPLISSGRYTAYKQLAAAGSYAFDTFGEGELTTVAGEQVCAGGRICLDEDGDRRVDFDGDGRTDFSFGDRDFNVRSLVGNAVLRWEYRPGSTLFLVWQRQQAGRVDVGNFDLGRDLQGLWDAPADNRFILKVNYWLGL